MAARRIRTPLPRPRMGSKWRNRQLGYTVEVIADTAIDDTVYLWTKRIDTGVTATFTLARFHERFAATELVKADS